MQQRAGKPVDFVIDINPAKQGKYLPATGLMVHSPDEALGMIDSDSLIYVMNSNYLEEIRYITGNKFRLIGVGHD